MVGVDYCSVCGGPMLGHQNTVFLLSDEDDPDRLKGAEVAVCHRCRAELCTCERCSAYRAGECRARAPRAIAWIEQPSEGFEGSEGYDSDWWTVSEDDGCRDDWDQAEPWTLAEAREWAGVKEQP